MATGSETVVDAIGVNDLPFAKEVYEERCARVHAAMKGRELDALVVVDPANMFYLSGYDGWSFYLPQALVLVNSDPQPFWVGRPQDKYGASYTTWLDEDHIRSYPESLVHAREGHPVSVIGDLIRELGVGSGRVGLEMDAHYFTGRGFRVLEATLPEATMLDSLELVNWSRAVKSADEINYMRRAAKVASAAMEVAAHAIVVGARECDAAGAIVNAQYRGVGDIMGEYPAIVPLIPSRERARAAHLTWSNRRYQSGDAINVELSGCVRRYHAPLARTLCLGQPSRELRHLASAVKEGLNAAIGAIRPEATAEEVEAAWQGVLAGFGYAKASRLGYSVGIGYPPDWGEHTVSLRAGDMTLLKPGMAFHVIGGMWLQDQGLEMSETVVVTETGSEVLTDFTRDLIVNDRPAARSKEVNSRREQKWADDRLGRASEDQETGVCPTFEDILRAQERLTEYASPTALLESSELSSALGAEVSLKMESLSDVGSFKWRGALNKMLATDNEQIEGGVVTYSTGNHGIAVATWARRLGIPAWVCVPGSTDERKLRRLRTLEAIIDTESADQDQAAARCYDLAARNGLVVIPPFDDPEVIAGQGTIGLEVLSEAPDTEVIAVPVSGGGLIAGVGLASRRLNPGARIVGVCAESAPAMYESVRAGHPVFPVEHATVADSLRGGLGPSNRYTFDLVSRLNVEIVKVTESEIEAAMRLLLDTTGLIAEGAAVTGIAALAAGHLDVGGKKIVLVVTGRNVDTAVLKRQF
ncbi:pyridoxal-phosphate dependent enzyme [Ferrimicrobium sp.]|uniref:pyridoxal-phosphate dependent enzyme n=1 Tax=Ferrimicrobium sp. TaxID=2926050 RepID=UPI00261C14F3|nr:pyridoxal-phosphate dependent enzyme [Ferrimicrobium sp.]